MIYNIDAFGMCSISKFKVKYLFRTCSLIHSKVLCCHGRQFNTVELLQRAKSLSGKKLSQHFIDSSFNEWCRDVECVVNNDRRHIKRCNPA